LRRSNGAIAASAAALKANPGASQKKRAGGTTPLWRRLHGDVTAVQQLDAGVDPNATNEAGATALMWAVPDPKDAVPPVARRESKPPTARRENTADDRRQHPRIGRADAAQCTRSNASQRRVLTLCQAAYINDAAEFERLLGAEPA
jgi:hypothetical protein